MRTGLKCSVVMVRRTARKRDSSVSNCSSVHRPCFTKTLTTASREIWSRVERPAKGFCGAGALCLEFARGTPFTDLSGSELSM